MTGPFEPIPAFPADGQDLYLAIEEWVRSPPMVALVSEFGGVLPQSASLPDFLDALEAFSVRWDFRRSAERSFNGHVFLNGVSEELVFEVATALGLGRATQPSRKHFDHVLILGGLAPSCFARCLGAADFIRRSKSRPPAVTALGSLRPLARSERTSVEDFLADEPANEFDALDAGLRLAFGVDRASEEDLSTENIRSYPGPGEVSIRVIAAPAGVSAAGRANTADTLEWFAERVALLNGGERLLLVTTSLYVPYQHIEGLRVLGLPYDTEIEMYGLHPSAIDPRFAPNIQAHHFLQEIRSTIRALRRLVSGRCGSRSALAPSRRRTKIGQDGAPPSPPPPS